MASVKIDFIVILNSQHFFALEYYIIIQVISNKVKRTTNGNLRFDRLLHAGQ